ncbi:hypothetical protein [Sphingosinithalassobacter portus]|uniref:hypothetical protein n=1 Tax=Stakelama portus TaxID=2676234 RepID=UPI000D6E0380|nr:hypothetical protein [Sphingosinithalassobacter portus]
MAMIGGSVAPIAAAARARARRRIIAYFLAQHAIGPEDAVAFSPQRPMETRAFIRLRAVLVVREGPPGRYWVDLGALNADERRRRNRMTAIMVPVLVVAALALMLLFYR